MIALKTRNLIWQIIVLLGCFLVLIVFSIVLNKNSNLAIRQSEKNHEFLSEIMQQQENILFNQNELFLELEKLDTLLALHNISAEKLNHHFRESHSDYKNHIYQINQLKQSIATSTREVKTQNELFNEQINFNQQQLKKRALPKLSLKDVAGKAELQGTNWVTRYSFTIKNFGGDISNLSLRYLSDSIPHIEFSVPQNGFLPNMAEIDVKTDSYQLVHNYHESYIYFTNSFSQPYRQKLYFIKNNRGFKFELGPIEAL
jgi:hypothetical protein